MKIFDFSNGKKGRLLGDHYLPNWYDHGMVDGKRIEIGRYGYHVDGGNDSLNTSAYHYKLTDLLEKYGVEAICYCEGQFKCGEGDAEWVWGFTASPDWVRNHLGMKPNVMARYEDANGNPKYGSLNGLI